MIISILVIVTIMILASAEQEVEFGRQVQEEAEAAAPLRKQSQSNHKTNRRNLQLQEGQENPDENSVTEHTVAPEPCAFCPDGLTNPDFVLPADDAATCAQASGFASTLNAGDTTCTTVQLAQGFCCPGVPHTATEGTTTPIIEDPTTATTTTKVATTEAPVNLPELEDGQCSCSPLVYNFELNFDQDCMNDDLKGTPGIGLTFCFLVSSSGNGDGSRRLGVSKGMRHQGRKLIQKEHTIQFEGIVSPLADFQHELIRRLAGQVEIISVQFLEFDTSGELIVINQDDSYSETTLTQGDVITFKSISNDLDADVPIWDQLDYLPGGVQLTLRGRVTDDVSGVKRIVSNRITWIYSNDCEAVHIMEDASLGWATVSDFTQANPDFCPAATTTTTEAPPATTEVTTEAPPTTTQAPTTTQVTKTEDITTEAPPVTTEPPPATTEAPPATPEAPPATTTTPDMSMPGKSGKGMFAKSAKNSKNTKQKETTDLAPQPHKTQKDHHDLMAKVYKDSSEDGQGGKGGSDS